MLYSYYLSASSEFSSLKVSSEAEPQELPSGCGTLQEAQSSLFSPLCWVRGTTSFPLGCTETQGKRLLWRIQSPADGWHPLRSHTGSGLPPFPHSGWPCRSPLCAGCNHGTAMMALGINTAEKNLVFLFEVTCFEF